MACLLATVVLWYSKPELVEGRHANNNDLDDAARGDADARVRSGGGLARAGSVELDRHRCWGAGPLRKCPDDDRRSGRRGARRQSPYGRWWAHPAPAVLMEYKAHFAKKE